MAVREYYKTDFALPLRLDSRWAIKVDGATHKFETSVLVDLTGNAKYLAFYVPRETYDGNVLAHLINKHKFFLDKANNITLNKGLPDGSIVNVHNLGDNTLKMTYSIPGELSSVDSEYIKFTGRIFIYTENYVPPEARKLLNEQAHQQGLRLMFRGPEYAAERNLLERPKAFISHDSRDKESIARPIATRLRAMRCPVWYDEFTLEVGDSLRESIEHGLRISEKCMFILTPNFLSKGGWPKREYQSIFTRELVEERNLILPIWSGVTSNDVYEYSPILADRVALKWDELGEEEVCRRLFTKPHRVP